jgi:hypothetical protein
MRFRLAVPLLAACCAMTLPVSATADEPAKPAEPAAPVSWQSGIKLNAQAEAGIVGNFSNPSDGENFGQLFTDHANQVQLNQILLTAARATDPKATGYDVGFKLQVMYGSDARYTHFLGELDRAISSRYELDIVEANVSVHLPWLTEGGIDVKAGQYSTPIGYEVIDPSANPFYSHSYIFNFGIPLKHTGVLAITHVNPVVDIYLDIDSGVNTSLGSGDNNGAPAGMFGFGLNLLDGNLTVLALSHVGPENSSRVVPKADSYMRYINDALVTYKASDKLSFTTEINYIHDDFAHADGYGAAQYVQYALSDTLTLNGRGEIWRDDKAFFVGAFPENLGFVKAEEGYPTTVISAAPTTYSEFTLGLTYKPALPAPVAALLIRPELRYDRSLNGTTAFNSGRDHGAFTVAADAVLGF